MPPRELKTFWLGLTLTITLRTQYKDVVCLIPVNKLDTALVQIMFDRVMAALDDIFLVLAVSTDNHASNRLVIVFLHDSGISVFVIFLAHLQMLLHFHMQYDFIEYTPCLRSSLVTIPPRQELAKKKSKFVKKKANL